MSMNVLETIFAALTVGFVGSLAGVLWRLSGVRRHVDQLQVDVDGLEENGKAVAGLEATVAGQGQIMELGRLQNETAHKAILEQVQVLTEHVLALRS